MAFFCPLSCKPSTTYDPCSLGRCHLKVCNQNLPVLMLVFVFWFIAFAVEFKFVWDGMGLVCKCIFRSASRVFSGKVQALLAQIGIANMPALLPGDWQGQRGSPLPLYKVILLARRSPVSTELLTLGVFVVPSEAISFQHQSYESQVRLQGLEKLLELAFFFICMESVASGISALWTL